MTPFTDGFRAAPYWWDRTPLRDFGQPVPPRAADVAIVGSGYTGLNAALVLARAGRDVVVFDAREIGWGCSTRNGGQVSAGIKPTPEALARRHGAAGIEIARMGREAMAWLAGFIARESIDCDWHVTGRFHGAHSPKAFEGFQALASACLAAGIEARLVSPAHLRSEIGSDAYHGGLVQPGYAALDPARYHAGLVDRVRAAEASFVPFCRVGAIRPDGEGFRLATSKGETVVRNVVLATNGYTDSVSGWLRRRLVPITSSIIATAPLPHGLMTRLMPRGRNVTDSRRVVFYYRPTPDGTRLLFGGRVAAGEIGARRSALRLRDEMVRIFPETAELGISHSWSGSVAFSFDTLPHVGVHEGVHYAAGYCGSGIALASFLGMRVAHQLLGTGAARTPLDELRFPARPWYFGNPWFVPAAVAIYRLRDRFGI